MRKKHRTRKTSDTSSASATFGPSLLFLIALVAGNLLAVTGCSRDEKSAPRPVVAVTAAVAQEKDVPVTLKAIGSVEASNTVSIRARIGGALTRVAFREGQDVKKGDLLFTIDPRPYQTALEGAVAALARDKAQLANAEVETRRYAELLKDEYVTKQQYDQVATTAEALRQTVRSDEAAV